MNLAIRLVAALALVGGLLCAADALDTEYRIWTTLDGKYSTEARLLDPAGDTVRLLRVDRRPIDVPIARLSDADRDYLRSAQTRTIEGKVISVADGDTLTVRAENENHRIRLVGIDTPESGQDFGTKAKQALSRAVFGKAVRVRWEERDRYERILGDVLVDGQWINWQLVQDGWAWHYVEYSDDPDLAAVEAEAREAKRGLWADANPLPPWEYRARQAEARREQTAAPGSPDSVRQPAQQLAYWLNTSSNVRHNSSCRHYHNTNRGRACGPNDGKACGICGG